MVRHRKCDAKSGAWRKSKIGRWVLLYLFFICSASRILVLSADKIPEQTRSSCVIAGNDRAFKGAAVEKELQIYPNIVSQTHADYTFSYKFNKTLDQKFGDKVYA